MKLSCASAGIIIATVALSACTRSSGSHGTPVKAGSNDTPLKLTATLVDPVNIDLKWNTRVDRAAGYFVEYSPNANNEFDIVDAIPPDATSFRHPDLMPRTRFVYRVLPYFGPASNVVELDTGKKGPQQPAPKSAYKKTPVVNGKSIRSEATVQEAAPTNLTAVLVPPAGVRLAWQSHSTDEDGFLVEIKEASAPEFKVSVFLDPGTTSLVSYGFPFNSKFLIRVRAFYYGQPSNLAEATTSKDPRFP